MSAGELNLTESWMPGACSLPTAEKPARVAEFDEFFSSAVLRVDRPEPGRLELELDPTAEVAANTAALVVRETACCTFFTFMLTATGGQLRLKVIVAPAHIAVLDALASRAATAMSGGDHRRRS
jgi:hypothetical protein